MIRILLCSVAGTLLFGATARADDSPRAATPSALETEEVGALTGLALSNPDGSVRLEAIRALEAQGGPAAGQALLALARDETDESLRSIAIRALATHGRENARSFFLDLLENSPRTNHRAEAARYFASIGRAGDLPALRAVLEREKVYYIRQKLQLAIDAIERRAGPPAPALIAPGEKPREPTLF